jgi:hypothetical protein
MSFKPPVPAYPTATWRISLLVVADLFQASSPAATRDNTVPVIVEVRLQVFRATGPAAARGKPRGAEDRPQRSAVSSHRLRRSTRQTVARQDRRDLLPVSSRQPRRSNGGIPTLCGALLCFQPLAPRSAQQPSLGRADRACCGVSSQRPQRSMRRLAEKALYLFNRMFQANGPFTG